MPAVNLDELHLSVRLSLREILALDRGEIPATLAAYVRNGVEELTRGHYGLKVARAITEAQADQREGAA